MLVFSFSFRQADAQDLTISSADVMLDTDLNTICDGGDVTYTVNLSTTDYLFAFNYAGDDIGDFTSNNSFTTIEGTKFTVTVKEVGVDGRISNTLAMTAADVVPLEVLAPHVEDAPCNGEYGEITLLWQNQEAAKYYLVAAADLDAALANPDAYQRTTWQIGRPAGDYYVSVNTASECLDLTDAANWKLATVGEPAVLEASATMTDPVICDGGTGDITVTVMGGTPDADGEYSVTLDGETKMTVDQMAVFMVTEGSYTADVMDENGCFLVTNEVVVVDEVDPVVIDETSVSTTDIICMGAATGTITVDPATGGSGSYTYTLKVDDGGWVDVDGYVDVTTTEFTGLMAGTYNIIVSDAAGCTGAETGNIVLTEPATAVDFTVEGTDITCFGANNGIAEITAMGGTLDDGGIYMFKIADQPWQELNTNPKEVVITGPGTYNVQVMDNAGCESAVKTVTINEPAAIGIELTPSNVTAACAIAPDGSIAVTVTGGVTADGTYMVSIDGENWMPTADDGTYTYTDLGPGEYTVWAKDDHTDLYNECDVAEENAVVDQPDDITFNAEVTANVECNGSDEGEISVTGIAGGTAPYYVTVDGVEKEAVDGAATFDGLTAGTYSAEVMDSEGCSWSINDLTVTEPTPLMMTLASTKDVGCTVAGMFEITVAGGTGTPMYYWSMTADEPGDDVQWSDNNMPEVMTEGDWYVWAKDENGCTVSDMITMIAAPNSIDFMVDVTGSPLACNGDATATIAVSDISGGTPDYMVTINGEEGDMMTDVAAGDYTVVVTDMNGCYAEKTVTVTQPDEISVTLQKAEGSFTENDAVEGYIEAIVTGGDGNYEYQLLKGTDIHTPWQDINAFLVGVGYEYTVLVRDGNGCEADASIQVYLTSTDPEIGNNEGFEVYPNPFNDRIIIDNNDKLTRLIVSNIAGQRVIDVDYPNHEIRTANLVSGVYLVRMFTEEGNAKTQTIIKR